MERGRREGIHQTTLHEPCARGIAGNIVVQEEALEKVPELRRAGGARRGCARRALRPFPPGVRREAGGRPRGAVQAGGPQRAAGRGGQGRETRRQGAAHQRRAGGQGARPPRSALRPSEAGSPLPMDARAGQAPPAGRGPGPAEDQGAQRVLGRVLPRPGRVHRPALQRPPRPAAGRGPDHAALREPGRLRHGRLPGEPRRGRERRRGGAGVLPGVPVARGARSAHPLRDLRVPVRRAAGHPAAASRAGRGRQRGRGELPPEGGPQGVPLAVAAGGRRVPGQGRARDPEPEPVRPGPGRPAEELPRHQPRPAQGQQRPARGDGVRSHRSGSCGPGRSSSSATRRSRPPLPIIGPIPTRAATSTARTISGTTSPARPTRRCRHPTTGSWSWPTSSASTATPS